MRKIKFRVWTGLDMVYHVTVGIFGAFYVNPGEAGTGLDPNDSASLTPFTTKYPDEIPVMQFTGLKDKNGKEIYEGDILQNVTKDQRRLSVFEISWYQPSCGFVKEKKGEGNMFTLEVSKYLEIIGNIYENPELLKA